LKGNWRTKGKARRKMNKREKARKAREGIKNRRREIG
jgi:hypothetical protein